MQNIIRPSAPDAEVPAEQSEFRWADPMRLPGVHLYCSFGLDGDGNRVYGLAADPRYVPRAELRQLLTTMSDLVTDTASAH